MKRLRVGFDARLALATGRGWGRYATELIRALVRSDRIDLRVLAPASTSTSTNDLIAVAAGCETSLEVSFDGCPTTRNLELSCPLQWLDEVDVLHSLTRFIPATDFRPLVATVHDLAPLSEPPFKTEYREATLEVLDRLRLPGVHPVAVSEFTRHELMLAGDFGCTEPPVIGEGVSPSFSERVSRQEIAAELANRFALEPGYFLHVGGAGPNKNLDLLLAAMARLQPRHRARLILAGDSAWGYRELMTRSTNTPWLEFTGHVEDRDLLTLYRGARALVAPSLHEGFGLPIVEAMAASCPVVCSRIPAFMETAANSALFFDPLSESDLHRQLERLLGDPALGLEIAARGRRRSRRYSWEAVGRSFIDLYRTVSA